MATPASSGQEVANERFNQEAAAWDSNKKHVESCEKAFEAIKRYVPAFADGSSKSNTRLPKHYAVDMHAKIV